MQQQSLDGNGSDARAPGNDPGGYPPDLAELRREVFRRDGYRCRLCGQEGGPRADGEDVELHAHHTVPPAEGGANTLDNLLTLCDSCHRRHHATSQAGSDESGATDAAGGRSVGALVVTWGTLVLLSFLSFTALAWARGEQLVDLSPYVALAGVGVLTALSIRLVSTRQQTAAVATAAAVGTWAVAFYLTDEFVALVGTGEPIATFLVVAVVSVVPFVLHRKFDVRL